MDLTTISRKYSDGLFAEIASVIGYSKLPLYGMMRYQLGWMNEQGQTQPGKGGKLLRPTLCLLTCELVGGDWHKALPAAAALELVHNFSLIHDDVEDASQQRRHRDTVWKVWGQAQAINAGDAMFALARLAVLRLGARGMLAEKVLHAISRLDEACLHLTIGQYLDISYEERLDIGVEQYLEMISGKTAALLACSFYLGALVGGADEPLTSHLDKFGHKLGLSFQIRDDILGIWGDKAATGKPLGDDIRRKKKSLPIVCALQKASRKQQEALTAIYSQKSLNEADVATVLGMLEKLGVYDYAQKMAQHYQKQAQEELERTQLPPQAVKMLRQANDLLLNRSG